MPRENKTDREILALIKSLLEEIETAAPPPAPNQKKIWTDEAAEFLDEADYEQ